MTISVFRFFLLLKYQFKKLTLQSKLSIFKKQNKCYSATCRHPVQIISSRYPNLWPQMGCFSLKWYQFMTPLFQLRFFCNSWGSCVKKNDTIRFPSKNCQDSHLFVYIYKFKNDLFTWLWPDLRWKHIRITSDDQTNVTIDFYGQNKP